MRLFRKRGQNSDSLWFPRYLTFYSIQQKSSIATSAWLAYLEVNDFAPRKAGGPNSDGSAMCQDMLNISDQANFECQSLWEDFSPYLEVAESLRLKLCLEAAKIQVNAISTLQIGGACTAKHVHTSVPVFDSECGNVPELLKATTKMLNAIDDKARRSDMFIGYELPHNLETGYKLAAAFETASNQFVRWPQVLTPHVQEYWDWLKGDCELPSN